MCLIFIDRFRIALAFSFRLPLDKSKAFARAKFKQLFSLGNRKMAVLLLVNFLIFIAYAQFYETFPLLAKDFISTIWIGVLFLINGITIALLQIPISNLMRKRPFLYLIIAHVLFFIGLLLLPLITLNMYTLIILGIIFISIAEIIFAPIYRSLCIKWNPKTTPEIALAKLNLMWGSGNSLAAYVGLYWIGHHYFAYPYLLGAAALVLAMVVLFFNRSYFDTKQGD